MHTKKRRKRHQQEQMQKKKKMITKIMKGPRCAKSTPHTLYSLSSFRSKKTTQTIRNGGKRSAILLCPECKQTIV